MKTSIGFLFILATIMNSQTLTLRGRVADLADQPAPGLRIMSAARADSVFTDDAGRFELTVDRSVVDVRGGLPRSFYLSEAFPNPGAFTTLTLSLDAASHVSAAVYNLLGQKVRDLGEGLQPAGAHLLIWDLRDDDGQIVGRGIYFVRVTVDGHVFQRKIAALPGAPATFASAAPRLAKTAGDLDLFISSPDGRYEDKVERLSVGDEDVVENVDIRVNRFSRLIYDGPDTIRAIVGRRDSLTIFIDDDEQATKENISITTVHNRIDVEGVVNADGTEITVYATPTGTGMTGEETVWVIFAGMHNGDSAESLLQFDISYKMLLEDILSRSAVSGVKVYGENGEAPIQLTETSPGVYEFVTAEDNILVGDNTDVLRIEIPTVNFAYGDSVVPVLKPDYHQLGYLKNLIYILNGAMHDGVAVKDLFAYVVHPHPGVLTEDGGLKNILVVNPNHKNYQHQLDFYDWYNGLLQDGSILDGRSGFHVDLTEIVDNTLTRKEDEFDLFSRLFFNGDLGPKPQGSLYMVFNNVVMPAAGAQWATQREKNQIPGLRTFSYAQYDIESPDGPANEERATSVQGELGEVPRFLNGIDWLRTLYSGAGLYTGPQVLVTYDGSQFTAEYVIAQTHEALSHATRVEIPEGNSRRVVFYFLDTRERQKIESETLEQTMARAMEIDPTTIAMHLVRQAMTGEIPSDPKWDKPLDLMKFYELYKTHQ